jgi:hypothetical protein
MTDTQEDYDSGHLHSLWLSTRKVAKYSPDQPRNEKGEFESAGGNKDSTKGDSSTNSTSDKFQALADKYAQRRVPFADLEHESEIAEASVFNAVKYEWQMSFIGCLTVQDTVDAMLNHQEPSERIKKYPESAFAAIKLVDYMTNPDSPHHYEDSETLYRGLSGEGAEKIANMEPGDTLKWGIASFTYDKELAGRFLDIDDNTGTMIETQGKIVGGNLGVEQVVGGNFKVVSKRQDSYGVMHVKIEQVDNIKVPQ